jgi:hypothetical protein
VATPLTGTINSLTIPSNGRTQLAVTAGKTYTYIIYLDAANDGNLLETGGDNTVSFGFLTGQAPTSKFDNTRITGTYASGTDSPVLPGVPNAVSPITLTPTVSCSTTCSGTFSAGSTNGNYSFVQATGRGTALASSGQLFQNRNAVFYIITANIIVVMGADQGVTTDAIGFIQF